MKHFTDTEKAAIFYYIYGGCTDKTIIFKIVEGEQRYNNLKDSSKNVTVSRWFNSAKIQDLIRITQNEKDLQDNENRLKWVESIQIEETKPTKPEQPQTAENNTNFLNLDEFLKYANSQANTIQDEKERRAWVEMIGKYMNFKESDEQEQQIKAYLPMICQDCELYKRCKGCKFDVCPVELV